MRAFSAVPGDLNLVWTLIPGWKAPSGAPCYSSRAIVRPSSSVGAAFFFIAQGRSVRPASIERCRSYGAWLNSGPVLAIDMALLPELEAPANQVPQSQEIRAAKMRPSQMWVMPTLESPGYFQKSLRDTPKREVRPCLTEIGVLGICI